MRGLVELEARTGGPSYEVTDGMRAFGSSLMGEGEL